MGVTIRELKSRRYRVACCVLLRTSSTDSVVTETHIPEVVEDLLPNPLTQRLHLGNIWTEFIQYVALINRLHELLNVPE